MSAPATDSDPCLTPDIAPAGSRRTVRLRSWDLLHKPCVDPRCLVGSAGDDVRITITGIGAAGDPIAQPAPIE